MTVRKILTVALVAIMMFSILSCRGDNDSSDTTTTQPIENGGLTVTSWMSAGYYKNLQSYTGPKHKKTEFDLYMAKNERLKQLLLVSEVW